MDTKLVIEGCLVDAHGGLSAGTVVCSDKYVMILDDDVTLVLLTWEQWGLLRMYVDRVELLQRLKGRG